MGKEANAKFTKQLCILTLVIFVASVFLRSHLTVWWPVIACFFFIVSMIVYFLSQKAKEKGMRKFANFYMASTIVKMLLYLAIIFIYVVNFKEDGKRFAIDFLIYYLIYTVFETYQLAKKDKKSDGNK